MPVCAFDNPNAAVTTVSRVPGFIEILCQMNADTVYGSAALPEFKARPTPPKPAKCLKNLLPFAAQIRYPCAWKMAYFSTEPAPERRNPTGKNRVWDFFVYLTKRTRQTAANPCYRAGNSALRLRNPCRVSLAGHPGIRLEIKAGITYMALIIILR